MTYRIESLLYAPQYFSPQRVGNRLYFISNLSGKLSLYSMDVRGGVPEPLLPPEIAMFNPRLMSGYPSSVFPRQGKIIVMLDRDGDEVHRPMAIPLEGGYPETAFGDHFEGYRSHMGLPDPETGWTYFSCESQAEPVNVLIRANLRTGRVEEMGRGTHGPYPLGHNRAHTKAAVAYGYTVGDTVLCLWRQGAPKLEVLYGKLLEERGPGEQPPLTSFGSSFFTPGDRGLLLTTSLVADSYGLGYVKLSRPQQVDPVKVLGIKHNGQGEMEDLHHLEGNRYWVQYNIDGCTWLYEGGFDEQKLTMRLDRAVIGRGELAGGVLGDHVDYDRKSDSYSFSYSTATSPMQLYTADRRAPRKTQRHTHERTLGIPTALLSEGEDASFTTYDGTRASARLYLPAKTLGFKGRRPLVYYVHGGPQGQERPDFAWFSMPLIQQLTLNGFAVFVPNVRGSTGYGLSYTKQVDHDWGGKDRLDHVHAMTKVLPKNKRLDVSRAGVIGRSYGGYMSLTQAGRHPELWAAAVDMFGPYDLLTFGERIPETWKPYFALALGDPVKDREFLVERSPRTYMDQLQCPLLVIQGAHDPRVVERESRDVVEQLRAKGKQADYLVFENEGHDVLRFENKVTCYNRIVDFFKEHLRP